MKLKVFLATLLLAAASFAAPVTMTPKVFEITNRNCLMCHRYAPFPSDIDLRTTTSLDATQMQLFFDGVSKEKAPAIHMLTKADKDTLLNWAVSKGASPVVYPIPYTMSWDMDDHIQGAVDGTSAIAPGRFFGYMLEDGWIYGATVNLGTVTAGGAGTDLAANFNGGAVTGASRSGTMYSLTRDVAYTNVTIDTTAAGVPYSVYLMGKNILYSGALVNRGKIITSPVNFQTRSFTKNGRTLAFQGIELAHPHLVNQDSTTITTNGNHYIVPVGIPWHGRWKLLTAHGYIKHGEYTSVTFHTTRLEPLERQKRDYVRFQIGHSNIGIISYPLSPSYETACSKGFVDPRLTGNLKICGSGVLPNYTNPQWFYMEVSITRVPSATNPKLPPQTASTKIRYRLVLKDPYTGVNGDPATWTILADLYGDRDETSELGDPNAVMGFFSFHKYQAAEARVGYPPAWAKWHIDVSEIVGSGGPCP